MDEQSHKEEMRAALRGDFERLRARRGRALVVSPSRPEPLAAPKVADLADDPVPPAETAGRGGWRRRLLGR